MRNGIGTKWASSLPGITSWPILTIRSSKKQDFCAVWTVSTQNRTGRTHCSPPGSQYFPSVMWDSAISHITPLPPPVNAAIPYCAVCNTRQLLTLLSTIASNFSCCVLPSYLNLVQGPRQQPTQAVQKHRNTGMMKPIAATSDHTKFTSAVGRGDSPSMELFMVYPSAGLCGTLIICRRNKIKAIDIIATGKKIWMCVSGVLSFIQEL